MQYLLSFLCAFVVKPKMPIIQVDHLTKEYRLGAMQGLKQTLLNSAARLTGKKVEAPPLFKALDDVSFSIEQGEVVGIIGHNGAGKSTLLKMLAKISTPTRGSIKVDGRIAPLIEVGAGFVPDFTGRENVYLNGAILGLSRQEIDKKYDEIVDFSGMAEFIDTPVKRYSSGMQVKLAFAVATSIESEILIVDEVLAVGDLAFQRKCFDRMENMIKRQGKTVLLVSHNIRQVERICSRVILVDHGTIKADGASKEICNIFYEISESQIVAERAKSGSQNKPVLESGELTLHAISLVDENSKNISTVLSGDDIIVSVEFEALVDLECPAFGVGIQTPDFLNITHKESFDEITAENIPKGKFMIICRFVKPPFLAGIYTLRLGVGVGKVMHTAFYAEDILSFQISARDSSGEQTQRQGMVATNATWRLERA